MENNTQYTEWDKLQQTVLKAGRNDDGQLIIPIAYTLPVTQETAWHLARMTPMLAGIDVDALDLSSIAQITIDETLYIGAVK